MQRTTSLMKYGLRFEVLEPRTPLAADFGLAEVPITSQIPPPVVSENSAEIDAIADGAGDSLPGLAAGPVAQGPDLALEDSELVAPIQAVAPTTSDSIDGVLGDSLRLDEVLYDRSRRVADFAVPDQIAGFRPLANEIGLVDDVEIAESNPDEADGENAETSDSEALESTRPIGDRLVPSP